ncbi:MAG TPA: D-2-hydroxyacid dehydrogenase [Candidatus Binatia bacterium]|nr:D-2-hydroxyacid dehydrogenase [Candidatus Binatia bacterium]
MTDLSDRSPRVLLHTDEPAIGLQVLGAAHPDLSVEACDDHASLPGLLERVRPEVVYSVRFAGAPGFPREALLECPSVRWISVGGSGTDHLRPWSGDRITVTNAAGVAAGMMAQYVLGAMLAFSLGFPGYAAAQRARRWEPRGVEPIDGKTVLILGLGKTGQAVAGLTSSLGLEVLGVRATPRPAGQVDEVHPVEALAQLWGRADFVVVCLPLTASTRGLVDGRAFAAMKPGAVLIDVSRGGVVVEAALLEALESGAIRGAALDVFEVEPLPQEHPLWGCGNVIMTPHCSAVFPGWQEKSMQMFSANLARYRGGEPLENVVPPERGY